MIHLIEHYLRLALRSFCDPPAEDVGDPIRGGAHSLFVAHPKASIGAE